MNVVLIMGSCQNPFFSFNHIRILLFCFLIFLFPISSLQQQPRLPMKPAEPPLSPRDACNGVFLEYHVDQRGKIHPFFPKDPTRQPFGFDASMNVVNNDNIPLEQWSLHLGFPKGTVIVSATGAVITDGSDFPYLIGQNGSVGISLSGSASTDLKTAIETAGDINQIQAQIHIKGSQFGVSPPSSQLPTTMSLDNKGFICPPVVSPPLKSPAVPTYMRTCCVRDPKFRPNVTAISTKFLPRLTGDLTIAYDVIQTYPSSYLALVKIENNSPLGRLDNWRLSWKWERGEFIMKTQGAYTTIVNPAKCLYGPQGQQYQSLDFSTVQNCDLEPTFLDLPVTMANDNKFGMIPFCCRNGTILPPSMDEKRSASAFQIEVYKMPPDLNRTVIFPPQNWQIKGSNGAFNPTYKCGPPVRVSPTLFPNTAGIPTASTSFASWQVVCNITKPPNSNPRCCVSFSGFYNESVIPCKTCACGCPSNVGRTCSAKAPAMYLPSEALLVPFDNRTSKALAWAQIKHFNVPNPMPCGDYCGVSINWHVLTDYYDGWSARITLFNWGDTDVPDWFSAFVMEKAYDGFEAAYSFNGTAVGNKTLFMAGLPGLNYLVKMDTTQNPNVPGKSQSVVSFKKKNTPGIDVVAGGGFPNKVYFNGEECTVPDIFPMSDGTSITGGIRLLGQLAVVLLVPILLLMGL